MKKLLALIILIGCVYQGNASHMSAGQLWYEYIGTPMSPNRYRVYLKLYRDDSGITLGNTQQLSLNSPCSGSQSYTMNLVSLADKVSPLDTITGSSAGAIKVPYANSCVDTSNSSLKSYEIFLYMKEVDLQTNCSYTFSFSTCCRTVSNNLVSQSAGYYIEAFLSRPSDQNSSPKINIPAAKSLCSNRPFFWAQPTFDIDGDSLYFEIKNPLSSQNTNVGFATGYSTIDPLRTKNGTYLNPSNGTLSFTPDTSEIVEFRIQATEYRYDSLLQNYYVVGHNSTDLKYQIIESCPGLDSIWFVSNNFPSIITTTVCDDTIINLDLSTRIYGQSVATDGSDFSLKNSLGKLVPIINAEAVPLGGQAYLVNAIKIKLNSSISYNDTLTLYCRVGNDLNTVVTECGSPLVEGDSLQFLITDCLSNVSLKEQNTDLISVYPNPVSNGITINLPEDTQATLILIDMSSRVLIKKLINNHQNYINLDEIDQGMYLIKVSNDKWSHSTKIEKL